MTDDLDRLLRGDLLRPPADFSYRVMQQLPQQRQTQPHPEPQRWRRVRWLVTAAGLLGGGLLGLSQLVSFVFGLWLAALAI